MKKKWQKTETQTAKRYGGRKTPRSGGAWGFKGDVKGEIFLFDDKYTDAKSFSIKSAMWKKICKEALLENRRPALKVNFADGTSFVVINEPDLYEMVEKLKGGEIK